MNNKAKWIYKIFLNNRKAFLISFSFSLLAAFVEITSISLLFPIFSILSNTPANDNLTSRAIALLKSLMGSELNLLVLIGIMLGLMFLSSLFKYFARIIINYHELRFNLNLKREFLSLFTKANWTFIIKSHEGRFLNIFSQYTTTVTRTLFYFNELLIDLIFTVTYIVFIIAISPFLTICVIAIGLIAGPILKISYWHIRHLWKLNINLQNDLANKFFEYFRGFKTFKSMSLEKLFLNELDYDLQGFTRNELRSYRISAGLKTFGEPFFTLIGSVVLIISYYWFSLEIGKIAVLMAVLVKLYARLNTFQVNGGKLFQMLPALDIYKDYQQQALAASENRKGQSLTNHIQTLEANNLSFIYPDGTVVFENVSFKLDIQSGLFGVAGPSGVGKSTFIDILSGLILPTSGSYKINEIEINNINLTTFRKKIGFVPQTPMLFKRSIKENISLEDDSKTNIGLMKECSQMADASRFIESLTRGYDTVIGEDGSNLSVGQIQRISIARALYQKPEILFFDEPTSALDKKSSTEVMKTIADISIKYPVFVISHDESLFYNIKTLIKLNGKRIKIVESNTS